MTSASAPTPKPTNAPKSRSASLLPARSGCAARKCPKPRRWSKAASRTCWSPTKSSARRSSGASRRSRSARGSACASTIERIFINWKLRGRSLTCTSGAWNEIQPGSYVFMDADYARNEWAAPLPRFEHSLFVLATVMSRPAADRAIVDAGLKASSVDSGMPSVWQNPGLTYAAASDEYGRVDIAPGAAAPALGEKLLLVPGHCDPTVNLYDWYVCARKGVVEALWPITARGASL